MKIQTFKITIAVPDENDKIKLVDLVDTLRNRLDEFNAENCAVEVEDVENGDAGHVKQEKFCRK